MEAPIKNLSLSVFCCIDASASLISRITDKIMPEVAEWQSRPLAGVYPVVFFDGIRFKVKKDGKVINKCMYSVLGIDMAGRHLDQRDRECCVLGNSVQ
jgi:transposase-like protein